MVSDSYAKYREAMHARMLLYHRKPKQAPCVPLAIIDLALICVWPLELKAFKGYTIVAYGAFNIQRL